MKIVLISCASKKLRKKAKAKDLYLSNLFKLNLNYAYSLNPDKIFILSAKYGLLDLDEEIEPYNLTLNKIKDEEIQDWANKVLDQLKGKTDLQEDEFIFLAGENYRKYLLPRIKNYKIPLKGLGIGKQLKFLKENLKILMNFDGAQKFRKISDMSEECDVIHKQFNSMKRFSFPCDILCRLKPTAS